MTLFRSEKVVGIFRGFSEGGLEFHADLVLPYRSDFQRLPMHGQFLLVQLEDDDEAVLGRITSISSRGRLASTAGEDYGIRAVAEERSIPEDLREQYLRYRVNMRVLGVLRAVDDELVFVASHRRLPHVGSKVALLADEILREVAAHCIADGADIGFYALGEFIYAGSDSRLEREAWMHVMTPCVVPKFRMSDLVARRTFVFARAGFGKSNLIKLLFSELYRQTPTVTKRGNRQVPVGTVIFDPDGEYFWPDDKNRPGLCDVPHLEDQLVVFTPRDAPSAYYQSFVGGNIRLDIRRLRPSDVISIALSPEKQDQQNVRRLRAMNPADWRDLVDLIQQHGNTAEPAEVRALLHLQTSQEAEMVAARANMTQIVRMLHDPGSQMMDLLFAALRQGKICVIDVSQMRGSPALILSGLILRHIFDHNQAEFTKAEPQSIPVIAVVEEAQAVLGTGGGSAESSYVTWVKEGRKFDLGAVLVTQQPGSISSEILSQGDNWFAFHLLSAGDLRAVKNANAHFSSDILSSLLNEPIPGQGVFWSSVGGKSYPIPARVLSFEAEHETLDPNYDRPAIPAAGNTLQDQFNARLATAREEVPVVVTDSATGGASDSSPTDPGESETEDTLATYEAAAIEAFRSDADIHEKLRGRGIPWMGVQEALREQLPDFMENQGTVAYQLVPKAMDSVFGPQGEAWRTEKRPSQSQPGKDTTWIVAGEAEDVG